jgi:hypothetical protein
VSKDNTKDEITEVLDRLEEKLIEDGETVIHQVDASDAITAERKRL